MSTLERRLAKPEHALRAPPAQTFCLLVGPMTDATAETWGEHWQKVEEAKFRGDFVAVVSPVKHGERPRYDQGRTSPANSRRDWWRRRCCRLSVATIAYWPTR